MKARVTRNSIPDFTAVTKGRTWDKWHRILGHIGMSAVKLLKKNNLVNGMDVDEGESPSQCAACIQGKQHVLPFPKEATHQDLQIGEIVTSDIWGPANTEGPGREKYYMSFTN
ncbi:hypothetical protein M422DRAFT_173145, partial [Sphaerobolus stellatus SS14]